MKKSIKFLAIAIAFGTFSFNLSLNDNGKVDFLSKANAQSTPVQGWREQSVDCMTNGKKTGTAVMCMGGNLRSCDPKECTNTPVTPPEEPPVKPLD